MREVVVITGASAGVGRATARAFARRGARIGLLARSEERLDNAAREVRALGSDALALACDVADADAVERAAASVERRFGAIDIWINCAMATVFAPFAAITPAEYRRASETTYFGYVWGTMAALRCMRARDRGTIVQVGSALAYRAIPLQSVYCGAKHAIRGFTNSLRSELIHEKSGVHVTMVQMPALDTPQFDWARNKTGRRAQPVPPVFAPEVAADAIVFAAHARRREVWVGGSTLAAISANKAAPGLLDDYLARTGYRSQLSAEPERPGRPDNLFAPAPGDPGAHGRFGNIAKQSSALLWLDRHHAVALLGAASLVLGAAFARRRLLAA
jgi:short-subunit dehydrogenase